MERSFTREVALLRKGAGDVFEGEGILAITKGLLQAGVSYVTGYQGAPVSHLMDVLSDAKPLLDELGVQFTPAANEAGAASMLAASINYPMRGAAVWKSTVGTNVASDALSNLASAGVKGGAVIIVGEDYGEGASIIQERTHAFAMKSSMWLMDPRPDHARFVDLIAEAFDLSEHSRAPVIMEFRIRACHVHGRFATKDNAQPAIGKNHKLTEPDFDYGRICLPPATYMQEKDKIANRFPAAIDFIRRRKLNELFPGTLQEIGIICQGGIYNTVLRALSELGLADAFGASEVPILCLNVTYPLVPDEITQFCAGKRAVLMVEEGHPDYLEQAVNALLRKADLSTTIVGKSVLPMAGEYTAEVMLQGVGRFLEGAVPKGVDLAAIGQRLGQLEAWKQEAQKLIGAPVPKRPPGFCTGCPERPVFSAIKLVERDMGKIHVSADIGCHTFSTLPPFNIGNSVLGYGLGLSSAAGVAPAFEKRVISIMGDGGFWHNGLSTGVTGAAFNGQDSVLVIMNNGYSSATGQQYLPSTTAGGQRTANASIEQALANMGISWVRSIRSYSVGTMAKSLKRALASPVRGLKVIVANGECQLARQRRIRPLLRKAVQDGNRVVRTRFGVDEDTCTGDHSCIRLSGCPSLTVKPNPDPLRPDPVAHVNNDCVGCGVCGEVADAAVLCPSFYRADIVQNPRAFDLWLARLRHRFIAWLQSRAAPTPAAAPAE
ncbi:MAG TPA: indolepyruvate ferredoxin oxidoreductase subunit alpha [Stellaceae bacterium]|nr:indolepyruvate ferredoxin oxidoreductase subunit alpha [Stellaceae bacterium]